MRFRHKQSGKRVKGSIRKMSVIESVIGVVFALAVFAVVVRCLMFGDRKSPSPLRQTIAWFIILLVGWAMVSIEYSSHKENQMFLDLQEEVVVTKVETVGQRSSYIYVVHTAFGEDMVLSRDELRIFNPEGKLLVKQKGNPFYELR